MDAAPRAKVRLRSSRTPLYVATVERTFVPIGVASMTLTRLTPPASTDSTCSGNGIPDMTAWRAGTKLSNTMVVLPDPDTPVTTVMRPIGISRSRGCTVWIRDVRILMAPLSKMDPSRTLSRTMTSSFPERYPPMIDLGSASTAPTVPWQRTVPPSLPEPGPISMSQSADLSALVSWSTRITEFPCSTRSPTMAIIPSRFEG